MKGTDGDEKITLKCEDGIFTLFSQQLKAATVKSFLEIQSWPLAKFVIGLNFVVALFSFY